MTNLVCAPVLLTVFNRPAETSRVIACIKEVKPPVIFIAADGPRSGRVDDLELCKKVQSLVLKQIDWPAKIFVDFSPTNLGLRRRMASAISWALKSVDRIIVLEDDCVAGESFFRFCTELLEKYESEKEIGVITGDNFQPQGFQTEGDYYFSRYPHCWGWATWRRSWNLYNDSMNDWPEVRKSGWLDHLFSEQLEALYWRKIFDGTYAEKIQSWAYRWTYSCWRNNLLTVTPSVNLVSNIGTGIQATNTCDADESKHKLTVARITFPIKHPIKISQNMSADGYVQKNHFGEARNPPITARVKRLLNKIIEYYVK
jgi:hypothetical protein